MKTLIHKLKSSLTIRLAICAASAALAVTPVPAQIFYGGITIVGTSNAPVQTAFVPITNLAYSSLQSRNLMVQNIQTNQTIIISYGYTWSGWGGTNLYVAGSITNTFPASAGWTNGATWVTNVAAMTYQPPISPWGIINLGNYTNTVSFQ